MRWTAASAAMLVASIWAVARAQTTTTSALAQDGGAPRALEDGGTVSRPLSAGPDGGVASLDGSSPGAGSTQIQRRNGVDYVGDGRISAAAPDGGASADQGASDDAGTRQTASSSDTDDLRRRISTLEQRLAAASSQQQELDRLNQQIYELRQQLAQAESQRLTAQQQAQQQAVETRARTQEAVSTLYAAQEALASGNGDVAATLSSAAASLPEVAQRELAAARQALSANDLYAARTHISAAIAASQR
jgi:hypothetical protein